MLAMVESSIAWNLRLAIGTLLLCVLLLGLSRVVYPQEMTVPDEILDIFDDSCALSGCHSGVNAPKGLNLSEEFIVSSLVNQPSKEKPNLLRVKPGEPASSYIIMKLKGSPGIEGERMPRDSKPLSRNEIAAIESWIKSLPAGMKVEAPKREYVEAFYGWTLANIPTAKTLEKGTFLFRIGHRFLGRFSSGYDGLFGIDPGAAILLQLSFPVNENLMLDFFRSRHFGDIEFAAKYRFLRERTDGSIPLSLAVKAGMNWESTNTIDNRSRTDSENFHYFGQLILTKSFGDRLSVDVVPGILLNGNSQIEDDETLVTVGLGGRVRLFDEFSIFGEWVPIVSGFTGTLALTGRPNRFDTWAAGVERKIGGHVFQIFISNSVGLATDQYMNGGDLDLDESFHLAFNIYRILRFPR